MQRNYGLIIAIAAMIYVAVMFLLDWDSTAVVVGAIVVGIVAVGGGFFGKESDRDG